MLSREVQLGSWKLLIIFSSSDQCITLFYVCFSLKVLYLTYSIFSLTFELTVTELSHSCCCCCCWVASVMSNSARPHRQQPTKLPRPWDSPGKNTGVGCHFLLQCMKVKSESEVDQSCPTPGVHMDWSPPGSSAHGIFQARVLEWGAIAFSEVIANAGLSSTRFPHNACNRFLALWTLDSTTLGGHLKQCSHEQNPQKCKKCALNRPQKDTCLRFDR